MTESMRDLRSRSSHGHRIGVFAIRRIKRGTTVFAGENEEIVWLQKNAIPRPPDREMRKLYEEFALRKKGWSGYPINFNRLTIAWFLRPARAGERANLRCLPEGYSFFATRDIAVGEELIADFQLS